MLKYSLKCVPAETVNAHFTRCLTADDRIMFQLPMGNESLYSARVYLLLKNCSISFDDYAFRTMNINTCMSSKNFAEYL